MTYFDRLAPNWDAGLVRNEAVIKEILDHADVTEGKDVLDVACGTGVLIPDYLDRRVRSVTAVDFSAGMIEEAKRKCSDSSVRFMCTDAETAAFNQLFDTIMVYNAFPHFPDPESLISSLSKHLKQNGILSIAHGMSREMINTHHQGSAKHVSNGLMPAEDLADIMNRYLHVTVVISDDKMYQVVGQKK